MSNGEQPFDIPTSTVTDENILCAV